MSAFLEGTLQLDRIVVDGVEADLFSLPDGSRVAVASPGGMGDTARSIGFLVDDLDGALAVLSAAGIEVGAARQNAESRYAHLRAPDGQLYEPLERREPGPLGHAPESNRRPTRDQSEPLSRTNVTRSCR